MLRREQVLCGFGECSVTCEVQGQAVSVELVFVTSRGIVRGEEVNMSRVHVELVWHLAHADIMLMFQLSKLGYQPYLSNKSHAKCRIHKIQYAKSIMCP